MAGRKFPWNEPVDCRFGAPMGRPGRGEATDEPVRLRCRFVDLDPYDGGGAYWGFGAFLVCAFSPDRTVVRWFRFNTRRETEEALLEDFPAALVTWG